MPTSSRKTDHETQRLIAAAKRNGIELTCLSGIAMGALDKHGKLPNGVLADMKDAVERMQRAFKRYDITS